MNRSAVVAAISSFGLVVAVGAAWAVTSGTNTQANQPQVQGDASSNTTARFPTNKQNEPTIAVNPVNSTFLVAGANDEQRQPPCGPGPVRGQSLASDCSFFPGVGTAGVYTSSDGGVTWVNRGLLDDQASWQGKGVVSDGDPVIAYGPKPGPDGQFSWANGQRAYYSALASIASLKGTEHIVVTTSDDNGITWTAPVIATNKPESTVLVSV